MVLPNNTDNKNTYIFFTKSAIESYKNTLSKYVKDNYILSNLLENKNDFKDKIQNFRCINPNNKDKGSIIDSIVEKAHNIYDILILSKKQSKIIGYIIVEEIQNSYKPIILCCKNNTENLYRGYKKILLNAYKFTYKQKYGNSVEKEQYIDDFVEDGEENIDYSDEVFEKEDEDENNTYENDVFEEEEEYTPDFARDSVGRSPDEDRAYEVGRSPNSYEKDDEDEEYKQDTLTESSQQRKRRKSLKVPRKPIGVEGGKQRHKKTRKQRKRSLKLRFRSRKHTKKQHKKP